MSTPCRFLRPLALAAPFVALAAAPACANLIDPNRSYSVSADDLFRWIAVGLPSLFLESLAVYAFLTRFGMRSVRVFAGLYAGNLAVFLLLFLPVAESVGGVVLPELVAFVCDAAFLWAFCRYSDLAAPSLREVRWTDAAIASAIGNAISYLLGFALFG